MRCLNRLHETTEGGRVEGSVLLDCQDIYAPRVDPVQVRRKIGMVFQRPNPFPIMTIYKNVVAGLTLEHLIRQHDLEPLAERCLRAVGMFDEVKDVWKHLSGAALSGDQQQRLVIARALGHYRLAAAPFCDGQLDMASQFVKQVSGAGCGLLDLPQAFGETSRLLLACRRPAQQELRVSADCRQRCADIVNQRIKQWIG
jgi:ABC-type ATPase involved in cell division